MNFLVESSTVRQNLLDLIKILCLSILAPMQRTVNRWFYKWYKVMWIVQLKPAVQELCEKYDLSEKIEGGRFEGKQITGRWKISCSVCCYPIKLTRSSVTLNNRKRFWREIWRSSLKISGTAWRKWSCFMGMAIRWPGPGTVSHLCILLIVTFLQIWMN